MTCWSRRCPSAGGGASGWSATERRGGDARCLHGVLRRAGLCARCYPEPRNEPSPYALKGGWDGSRTAAKYPAAGAHVGLLRVGVARASSGLSARLAPIAGGRRRPSASVGPRAREDGRTCRAVPSRAKEVTEMAENPTTLDDTQLPAQPQPPVLEGVPPVLDEAHIGDIRGALGTIRMDDTGARHGWRSRAMALLAIMGPGLIVMVGDNDAGGVSTYAQAGQNYGTSPAVGADPADPGADRQPGDGDPPRRRHRRRPRAADQRALRALLGLVLGRGPVHPQLPHDRHRVHRRQPRAGVLRREQVRRRAGRRRGARGDHRDGQLPQLGALHVRVRGGQLPGDPAAGAGAPRLRHDRARHGDALDRRRGQLDGGAADHRDRRHHGGAVAAVLPAVQHHRQADHAALDQLRARRHGDRGVRGGDRRRRDHLGRGVRVRGHARGGALRQRGHGGEPRCAPTSARRRGRALRSCCSTPR